MYVSLFETNMFAYGKQKPLLHGNGKVLTLVSP